MCLLQCCPQALLRLEGDQVCDVLGDHPSKALRYGSSLTLSDVSAIIRMLDWVHIRLLDICRDWVHIRLLDICRDWVHIRLLGICRDIAG